MTVFNGKHSSTAVRVTKILRPRPHQSFVKKNHPISMKSKRSETVIHSSICSPGSIICREKKSINFDGDLQLIPSQLINHKNQYQSKSQINQSSMQWPNKISPTFDINTHHETDESLSVIGDRKQSCLTTKPRTPIEFTKHQNHVATDSFRIDSQTNSTINNWDTELVDNYHRSPNKNKYKNNLFGGYFCCPYSSRCLYLSLFAVALLIAVIATIPIVLFTSAKTTMTVSTTSTTATMTSITTTTATSTSTTTITTTSTTATSTTSTTETTTTTTVSTSTTATTTTTTAPYCATTCTGNHINYSNATTCGLTCVDTGSYTCQNASTYCASGTFSFSGSCNAGNGDSACPSTYCCVFDTYSSSAPYLCMRCNSVG